MLFATTLILWQGSGEGTVINNGVCSLTNGILRHCTCPWMPSSRAITHDKAAVTERTAIPHQRPDMVMAAITSGSCNASGVLAVTCHVIYSTGLSKVGCGNAVLKQCGTLIIYYLMHDALLGLVDMRRGLCKHNTHHYYIITCHLNATTHEMAISHAAICECMSQSSGDTTLTLLERWVWKVSTFDDQRQQTPSMCWHHPT